MMTNATYPPENIPRRVFWCADEIGSETVDGPPRQEGSSVHVKLVANPLEITSADNPISLRGLMMTTVSPNNDGLPLVTIAKREDAT